VRSGLKPGPRSAIYLPAHADDKWVDRLDARPDALIVDLEDTVPDVEKESARREIRRRVDDGLTRADLVTVRVNSVESAWFDLDLEAVIRLNVHAVVLPKSNVESVRQLARRLESEGSGAAVWAMVESLESVEQASLIARSSPRVTLLVVGSVDLAKEVGVPLTDLDSGLYEQRKAIAVAAKVGGVAALDGIFLGAEADLSGSLRQSRALGFCGRTVARSSQIEACRENFDVSPTTEC
jgi:citrate lyase subunit beta / citryl-CoA lyase